MINGLFSSFFNAIYETTKNIGSLRIGGVKRVRRSLYSPELISSKTAATKTTNNQKSVKNWYIEYIGKGTEQ